jgi:glutamate 5-kinase
LRAAAPRRVASGREPDVLVRLGQGEAIGTLLVSDAAPLAARKQWLADHVQVNGTLHLDAGAARAVATGGKSLLPIGVRAVAGDFERGALVACIGPDGREVARGLSNYGAVEARRIVGRPSTEIESILGYVDEPELIHRTIWWWSNAACRTSAASDRWSTGRRPADARRGGTLRCLRAPC